MNKVVARSIVLRVLIIVFCIYLLITVGALVKELSSSLDTLKATQDENKQTSDRIEEKNNLLQNSTEQELIERAARESLGYLYPNEQVIEDIN